jgi:hypothetical protein
MEKVSTTGTSLTKTNSRSSGNILTALGSKQFSLILGALPRSIEDALECPPVQQLVNQGASISDLEGCLAVEIARVSNMLTVGGNLRQGQSVEIARTLIADYPNESLQDFCLCLRKGIKGDYGDIFRFDILVIHGWFKQYLEEKYTAAENKLMQEKDELYKPVKPEPAVDPEAHQKWLDKLKEVTSPMDDRKIAPITDQDIRKEGKERRKYEPYPVTQPSEAIANELHREYVRQNYDIYTAAKLPTWVSEEQWLSGLSKKEKKQIIKQTK